MCTRVQIPGSANSVRIGMKLFLEPAILETLRLLMRRTSHKFEKLYVSTHTNDALHRERIFNPIGLWFCVHFYIHNLHTQFDLICTVPGSDPAFGDLLTSPKSGILKWHFFSVEFIETCSIAQSKKQVSPLFFPTKQSLFPYKRGLADFLISLRPLPSTSILPPLCTRYNCRSLTEIRGSRPDLAEK